jgi:carboxyl-terminal processing protease
MSRTRPASATLALAAILGACGGDNATPPPTQPGGHISDRARAYLDQLIGVMQVNSVNRLTIDWTTFRTTVFGEAPAAQSVADTYPAIRTAIRLLGDGHSGFYDPSGTAVAPSTRTCAASTAGSPAVPATIGYVKVPAFAGTGTAATAFANAIQQAIMSADRDDLTGWIVDVRGNGGGNMWPMIAGAGPVLGEGVVGYFIDPAGVESVWGFGDGAARLGGVVQVRVDAPYRLKHERPRVAVLVDGAIASAGEGTIVAFRGRPDTRAFGTPTCGQSTGLRAFPMTDGATLALAVSVMADRTRTKYGQSIVPDDIATDPDDAVARAIAWLQSGS